MLKDFWTRKSIIGCLGAIILIVVGVLCLVGPAMVAAQAHLR